MNNSYLAKDQSFDFSISYTGSEYNDSAKTAALTVEYYIVNDNGVRVAVPGTMQFPLYYQTTNGPAVINASESSIKYREVLANNIDSDSYLLNLTNDSETPSGKIEFNAPAPFSIESTNCTTLTPHDSCSVKVGFGKTTTVQKIDIYKYTQQRDGKNLEIKYFGENSNVTAKTTTVALAGEIVPADKVYVKLESVIASGRLFGGDGSTKTPYNVEVGGSPLNLQLTYRNTGTFVVDNFNVNAGKLPTGFTVVKNDCANTTLVTNATCNISLNAATRKVGAESLDLQALPVSWTGHETTTLNYAGSNVINVNIHPKSTYQLETILSSPSTPKGYRPGDRMPGQTRYFFHDEMIQVAISGTNFNSPNPHFRIDPKSLPKGMECMSMNSDDPCDSGGFFYMGLMADRSVPDGVYHIKAEVEGHSVAADIMILGWWQVGNTPVNNEIKGLAAANNNLYVIAANNKKIFYNNTVVNPRGGHNWSATNGIANMSKLSVNDGNLCLVANGKDLYSTSNIAKGVQGLTRNFSLANEISNVACMSGDNKSLDTSGNNVYYYDSDSKSPQALSSALQPITSMVANSSKVYFADGTKTIYTALNSSIPNAPKVAAIPQWGTDIQGQQYWPNYSWLLALSTDKTKLFSQVLNKTNTGAPNIYSNEEIKTIKTSDWIYGSYFYRTTDDGATWNKDTRLGQSWALLLPNFLPVEMVASNDLVWTIHQDRIGLDGKEGTIHPNLQLSGCGYPEPQLDPWYDQSKDRDNNCKFLDSPVVPNNDNGPHPTAGFPNDYGFNHIAYDPTYNMVYYSDNYGNIYGEWATTIKDQVPYPGTPTYY